MKDLKIYDSRLIEEEYDFSSYSELEINDLDNFYILKIKDLGFEKSQESYLRFVFVAVDIYSFFWIDKMNKLTNVSITNIVVDGENKIINIILGNRWIRLILSNKFGLIKNGISKNKMSVLFLFSFAISGLTGIAFPKIIFHFVVKFYLYLFNGLF